MKKLKLFTLFLILTSFTSINIIGQEKPKFHNLIVDDDIDDNMIHLKAKVINSSISTDIICNQKYSNTVVLQIIKIIQSGSKIVNPIQVNKKYRFNILKTAKKSVVELNDNNLISVKVKEGLCRNMSSTIYEIVELTTSDSKK